MARIRELVSAIIKAKHPRAGERYNWDGDQRRFIRNVEGFLGEWAVCQFLSVPFRFEVHQRSGDRGFDVETPDGMRVSVKSTAYENGRLLIKAAAPKPGQRRPDFHVLVIVDIDTGAAKLAGWCTDVETNDREPERVRTNGPLNYVLSQYELSPIADLLPNDAEAVNEIEYQKCRKLLKAIDVPGGVVVNAYDPPRRGTLINAQTSPWPNLPGVRVVLEGEQEIVKGSETKANAAGTPISRDFYPREVEVI
jgi:hypothetical protein